MGWSESATAIIGIKILLSDLISQIDESNFDLIKNMICDGCIEDSNEFFNEVYENIINGKLPENYLDYKNYLTNKFENNGSLFKERFSNNVQPDLTNGTLFEQYLLVSVKYILDTERWGYNRNGVNSTAIPLDFDLSVDLKMYENIKNFSVVFFIKQNSG